MTFNNTSSEDFLCALSKRSFYSFFSLSANLILWSPLKFNLQSLHALLGQTVSGFLFQRFWDLLILYCFVKQANSRTT